MSPHRRAPEWMLAVPLIDERCQDCGQRMHGDSHQKFCLVCWEQRMTAMDEEAARVRAAAGRRLRLAHRVRMEDDDTGGYLIQMEEAAADQDIERVIDYKWRVAVLEMTGKRLPFAA